MSVAKYDVNQETVSLTIYQLLYSFYIAYYICYIHNGLHNEQSDMGVDPQTSIFSEMFVSICYFFVVWLKIKLWVIKITFDLPKQAATPKFGIQVVLTTEPKPVTVCETEPSCQMRKESDLY